MVKIVNCRERDIAVCAGLLTQVYAQAPYLEAWEIGQAQTYLNRFLAIEPQRCFVALWKDQIVGAIFAFSWPWQNNTIVYIQELFVAASHRRRGTARALVQAITLGQECRVCLIANQNSPAAQFYTALGFSQSDPYKLYSATLKS